MAETRSKKRENSQRNIKEIAYAGKEAIEGYKTTIAIASNKYVRRLQRRKYLWKVMHGCWRSLSTLLSMKLDAKMMTHDVTIRTRVASTSQNQVTANLAMYRFALPYLLSRVLIKPRVN